MAIIADEQQLKNGTVRKIDSKQRVYYDGYWIRYYRPPEESLAAKKNLIVGLTRRAFHHTEPGINTPGDKLDLARAGYERAQHPSEKRVSAAMLAGALFNRATDIFTTIVELGEKGVLVSIENELMKECSDCLQEAMQLGKSVRHYSGNEGVDELWGEPLKAFSMSIEEFYKSRYIKISLSMRDIDRVAEHMIQTFNRVDAFAGIDECLREFAKMAKMECEITKADPEIFDVWPKYVTSSDRVQNFKPSLDKDASPATREMARRGSELLENGRKLIMHISGVRVPISEVTKRYLKDLNNYDKDVQRARRLPDMSANNARSAAICETVDRIREIEREHGVTPASLEKMKDELLTLAKNGHWFTREEFSVPADTDHNSCIYRLSEDDTDNRFALYVQAAKAPLNTPAHNHDTWAVIVGIHGDELNRFYQRTDCGVEVTGSKVVQQGTGVALMPEDLHSIHITDEDTVVNFHMYGLGLEYLKERQYFDTEKNQWKVFPVYDEIIDAR